MWRHAAMVFATLAVTLPIVACEGGLNRLTGTRIAPGVELSQSATHTFVTAETCDGAPVSFSAEGTDELTVEILSTIGRGLGEDLPTCERDAEMAAEIAAMNAELPNYCRKLYVKVSEPHTYQRHEVCADHEWALLERTTVCDDMMIVGEQDEPSFQCRPVIEPPIY
jgi:hypothetical protein